MKQFNTQFATQRLLQEQQGPFYVVYNKGYGQGKGVANNFKSFPSFEAAQAFADEANNSTGGTFSKFQKYYYVVGSDHEDFEWISQAAHDKAGLDKEIGEALNEVKFTIDDSDLYSAVMDRYMRGASIQDMLIKDEGDYFETDEETFQGVQAIAMDLDKVDALQYYNEPSDYMKYRQDPEYYEKEFQKAGKSDYFQRRGMDETSATGAGANFVPGTGEQLATPKAFKKTQEQKDVEPKLAAGKAKVYMKDKWGWKYAPSIPNRPSKGGFVYKQLYEGIEEEANEAEWPSEVPSRYGEYIFKLVNVMPDGAKYDVIDAETGKKEPGGRAYRSVETLKNAAADLVKPKGGTQSTQLEENYSRFKKETKTRTNEQQLHAAMRLAEKKIHEANRILEYTAQLRGELNETKVNKNTQKLMEKITRGIAEAYGKMKKMK